jgi:hypothetical protein
MPEAKISTFLFNGNPVYDYYRNVSMRYHLPFTDSSKYATMELVSSFDSCTDVVERARTRREKFMQHCRALSAPAGTRDHIKTCRVRLKYLHLPAEAPLKLRLAPLHLT